MLRRFSCLLLTGLFLVFNLPALAQDEEGEEGDESLVWDSCPMPLESYEEGFDIDCGYFYVPEDRSDPNSPEIELAFAIVYSYEENPLADPIIYLEGGPGGSALNSAEFFGDVPMFYPRDLILIDQRGTGYSSPTLNCPEVENEEDNAVEACRDRLLDEGINLQAYNSAENAADVVELASALGYDEYNLYGVSYGTRLALTIMRDYPEGVRSVILDSVYPPHINSWEEYGNITPVVMQTLFDGCAADPVCDEAYPDLGNVFYELADTLDTQPAEYEAEDPETGEIYDATLDGNDLIDRVFQLLYSSETIPYLPQTIYAIADGDYAALDALESGVTLDGGLHRRQDDVEDEEEFDEEFIEEDYGDVEDSEGMNLSVECQEEIPFIDLDRAYANVPANPIALSENIHTTLEETFSDCEIWGVSPSGALENQPVISDIPTLVFAGEYDPITPASWAESTHEYLSSSYFYVFPGLGHGVTEEGTCPPAIAAAFLDDPYTEPDGSCIDSMGSPEFITD